MADDTQSGLRDRIARQGEDALGKLAQELLENPLVNSAIARAFTAREKAVQAQEATMGALNIPSATYVDLTLGYTFKETLELQVGGENLGDEEPPILYQNNVINGNTDVQTYDTVGRFYWARLSYNFK